MTASLLQSCRTHGCKPLWLLGPGDPRWVGSPQVEAAKAGCVQTPSCEMLRPRFHYWSRLRGERGDVSACCPGLWEELQSALEATKLEAWAPGGTFKMPLSGWKIGIFFLVWFWCGSCRLFLVWFSLEKVVNFFCCCDFPWKKLYTFFWVWFWRSYIFFLWFWRSYTFFVIFEMYTFSFFCDLAET